MAKLISAGKNFWAEFKKLNRGGVSMTLTGPRFVIPTSVSDRLAPERSGFDVRDNSPFYTSDLQKLYDYYQNSVSSFVTSNLIGYADIWPAKTKSTHPFSRDNVLDFDILKISVHPGKYFVPEKLRKHGEKAVDFFKKIKKINFDQASGCYENNETLRIEDVIAPDHILAIRANYFDQVSTNLTLDWDSECLGDPDSTIRRNIEPPINGKLCSLNDSVLANTLGIAVMMMTPDLRPILRVRSESLASISKRGLHCTVSGVFEIPSGSGSGEFGSSYFSHGLQHEILMETGLNEGEYDLYPVALARELARGGKPQLFYVGIPHVSEAELRSRAAVAKEHHEYVCDDELEKLFDTVEFSGLAEKFTYEGWASLQLTLRFLAANENIKSRLSAD